MMAWRLRFHGFQSQKRYNKYYQMSIYSGFPTRKDETKYNDLLSKLILMLQQHLLEVIQGEMPHKKQLAYTKVISRMKQYEEHKYLPPKFTDLLHPLCDLIGLNYLPDVIQIQTTQIQEKLKYNSEQSKSFAQSANKERVRSKLAPCLEILDPRHVKKSTLLQQHKQLQLQSTSHLRQRKNNYSMQAGEASGVQVAATYEEQELSRANTSKNVMRSQPIIISSKIKNSLRYRAFQALSDAHQNLQKRNTPLRQELRHRLKSHEYSPNDS